MPPTHNLNAFIAACARNGEVTVKHDAMQGAKEHFRLRSAAELLLFVARGGLQEICFKESLPWRNEPALNAMVDSYTFRSGKQRGYIAFAYIGKTSCWVLKSFKPDRSRPRFENRGLSQLAALLPLVQAKKEDYK